MSPPAAFNCTPTAAIAPVLVMSPPGICTSTCPSPLPSLSSTWRAATASTSPFGAASVPALRMLLATRTTLPPVEVIVPALTMGAVLLPESVCAPPCMKPAVPIPCVVATKLPPVTMWPEPFTTTPFGLTR